MNKIITISILIIAILAAIVVSSPKNQGDEVVFWTLQMNDFAPYMNKVISDFESQNPDIKIKWVDVPFSEGEKRTLASVLSDNPPDLINLNPDFSTLLAQRGALYEIDEKYSTQFNESIINSLKYNEKLYSLPWYATSAITIYNKKLLAQSGVDIPKTYEDVLKIAPEIRKKNDAYVFLPNITENDTMVRILNKYGINSPETINSEKSAEVFNMFKTMYETDLIPKETVTQTHREALEKYMAEKTVLFQAGANFLNMIRENAPSTYQNTDVASQITGSIGQNDFSLMNLIIPLKAKHKDQALKFALFLTNSDNQLELAKLTNILAVNKETLQNDFYNKYDESDLMAKARVISANQLNKINPPLKQLRNQKELNTLINTSTQQILLNKAPTKTILDQTAIKFRKLEE